MSDFRNLRALTNADYFPSLNPEYAHRRPAFGQSELEPPPRILLLYGSLRERSYSSLIIEESARLMQYFSCETRIFDPSELPLPDQVEGDDHPAVANVAGNLESIFQVKTVNCKEVSRRSG